MLLTQVNFDAVVHYSGHLQEQKQILWLLGVLPTERPQPPVPYISCLCWTETLRPRLHTLAKGFSRDSLMWSKKARFLTPTPSLNFQ